MNTEKLTERINYVVLLSATGYVLTGSEVLLFGAIGFQALTVQGLASTYQELADSVENSGENQ